MKNRVAPYHQRANRRDTDGTRIALRAHPSGPASTASGYRIDIFARPGDSDAAPRTRRSHRRRARAEAVPHLALQFGRSVSSPCR